MLERIETPDFIQEYIDAKANTSLDLDVDPVVYQADVGYLMIFKYKHNPEYYHGLFGGYLPGDDRFPYFYMNRDSIYTETYYPDPTADLETTVEHWKRIAFGLVDPKDYDKDGCRIACVDYSKEELDGWLDDETERAGSLSHPYSVDEAVKSFLDHVTLNTLSVRDVLEHMKAFDAYPFNLIKKVNWLN